MFVDDTKDGKMSLFLKMLHWFLITSGFLYNRWFPSPYNIILNLKTYILIPKVQYLKTAWISSSGTSIHDLLQWIQQEMLTWENLVHFGHIGSHSNFPRPSSDDNAKADSLLTLSLSLGTNALKEAWQYIHFHQNSSALKIHFPPK